MLYVAPPQVSSKSSGVVLMRAINPAVTSIDSVTGIILYYQ
jgi:hypothetical protein